MNQYDIDGKVYTDEDLADMNVQGISLKQLSKMTGVPETTLKGRLKRAVITNKDKYLKLIARGMIKKLPKGYIIEGKFHSHRDMIELVIRGNYTVMDLNRMITEEVNGKESKGVTISYTELNRRLLESIAGDEELINKFSKAKRQKAGYKKGSREER